MAETKLPNNSFTGKSNSMTIEKNVTTKEQEVEVKQIATAKKSKKSLGRKFEETFFDGASDYIGNTLVNDVVVPTLKDMFMDLVTTGLNMALYKGGSTPVGRGGYPRSTGFRGMATKAAGMTIYNSGVGNRARVGTTSDRMRSFDDIVFETDFEARDVLDQMLELIETYGSVSVAKLHAMCGITAQFTDREWGWMNLAGARVRKGNGGYILQLPKIMELN